MAGGTESSRHLTRSELAAGLASAIAVFGFIAVATPYSGNEIVRTVLIGPCGASGALWLFAAGSALRWWARKRSTAAQT